MHMRSGVLCSPLLPPSLTVSLCARTQISPSCNTTPGVASGACMRPCWHADPSTARRQDRKLQLQLALSFSLSPSLPPLVHDYSRSLPRSGQACTSRPGRAAVPASLNNSRCSPAPLVGAQGSWAADRRDRKRPGLGSSGVQPHTAPPAGALHERTSPPLPFSRAALTQPCRHSAAHDATAP